MDVLISELKFENIYCFDLDWTLIKTKSGKTFPINDEDWEWMYESIPLKLQELYNNDNTIIIFTNQKKNNIKDKCLKIQKELKVPINIFISNQEDKYRKPRTGMYEYLKSIYPTKINDIIYYGDAAGRQGDFSDSDILFAYNCNMKFDLPENIFCEAKKKIPNVKKHPLINYISSDYKLIDFIKNDKNKQAIIMVGPPASGKSTLSNLLGYKILSLDILKTNNKLLKELNNNLNKSVIIDNTNPSKKKRKEYIDILQKNNYNIICVYFDLPEEVYMFLNNYRTNKGEKYIPKIAYNIYNKNFEKPSLDEGFVDIITINSVLSFPLPFSSQSEEKGNLMKYLF